MNSIARKFSVALVAFAARTRLAALAIALLALFMSALPSLVAGALPQPTVHDEFSYLLAADTFLHGRLTNPTPPMWRFFQTFHELMTPTYMSKYPPGQGLFLALGTLLFGQPIAGVWISAVLASVAIFWMLGAWFPPRWALTGGVLAAATFTASLGWTNTYWGGSVAQLGAATVWGAVGRLARRRPRIRDAIIAAIGFAICANSRPLESAAITLPAIVLLILVTLRRPSRRSLLLRHGWLPMAIGLIITALLMGLYNRAITGHALQMPYQLYTRDIAMVPVFYWQPIQPHDYDEPRLERMNREEAFGGEFRRDPMRLAAWWSLQNRKFNILMEYLAVLGNAPLLLVVPLLVAAWKNAEIRWLAAGIILLAIVSFACVFASPHYYAGMIGLLIALIVAALQQLERWAERCRSMVLRRLGRVVVILIFAKMLIAAGSSVQQIIHDDETARSVRAIDRNGLPHSADLAQKFQFEDWLARNSPRGALVFVNYLKPDSCRCEWVYNRADIDASPVVWAHDRGAENTRLIAYYPNRSVWMMTVDTFACNYSLRPYAPAAKSASLAEGDRR